MTPAEWISAFNAAGAFLAGFAAIWGVIVSKRGVAVSTQNAVEISAVKENQATNKTEIKDEIQGVRHDLRNGGGTAIATQVVEQMKPVLAEMGEAIPTRVAETAAAVLAEHKAAWDGVERRSGPPDRRGQ